MIMEKIYKKLNLLLKKWDGDRTYMIYRHTMAK